MCRAIFFFLLFSTSLLFAGTPAPLEQPEAPEPDEEYPLFSIAATGGTQGRGMSIGWRFNPYLGLRLRGAKLSYGYDDTWGNLPARLKLNGDNAGLLLDIYPFGGNFYITAGLTLCECNMRGKASFRRKESYDCIIELGGSKFMMLDDTYGEFSTKYAWDHVQPYFGIGYTDTIWEELPLYYAIDLGFNYMGTGKLRIANKGNLYFRDPKYYNWSQVSQRDIESALRSELCDFLEFAERLRFYPVVQLSIGLQF